MTESLVKEYYTGQVRKEWRRLVRDAYHYAPSSGGDQRTHVDRLPEACLI
jgi:hypothetical protein